MEDKARQEQIYKAHLESSVRVAFSILRSIGPVTIAENVGPRLLVAHTQRTENGVTLKGKFWHYYPNYNFKAQPTFRLELSVEIQPEATPAAVLEACSFLKEKQAWNPTFTADETEAVLAVINSGAVAEYLRG